MKMILKKYLKKVYFLLIKIKMLKKFLIGVNIHGLFIQGCRWDEKNRILEDSFKKELFRKMPVIW